jgi:hypothetical protein
MKEAVEAVVESIDTTARVAFVTGGAWLLGHFAWRVLGSLILDKSEPTASGMNKAA